MVLLENSGLHVIISLLFTNQDNSSLLYEEGWAAWYGNEVTFQICIAIMILIQFK